MNILVLHSSSTRTKTRGIPEDVLCRILMFLWLFGPSEKLHQVVQKGMLRVNLIQQRLAVIQMEIDKPSFQQWDKCSKSF